MGRRTDDNHFMLVRMIEMARVRKDCLFVAFIDMEKAYDRVNRKKLFERIWSARNFGRCDL